MSMLSILRTSEMEDFALKNFRIIDIRVLCDCTLDLAFVEV